MLSKLHALVLLQAVITIAANPISHDGLTTVPFPRRKDSNSTVLEIRGNAGIGKTPPSGTPIGPILLTLENQARYTMPVGFGTATNQYTLVVDTGSGLPTTGLRTAFIPQNAVQANPVVPIPIKYGAMQFQGKKWTGSLFFTVSGQASPLEVKNQGFGVSDQQNPNSKVDGVLGLPVIEKYPVSVPDGSTNLIVTVPEDISLQNNLPSLFALDLHPVNALTVQNGQLTFGGSDPNQPVGFTSLITGDNNWRINIVYQYGDASDPAATALTGTRAAIDSGSSIIYMNSADLSSYLMQAKAQKNTNSAGTSYWTLSPQDFQALKPLVFNIKLVDGSTKTLTLYPDAQVAPLAMSGGSRSGYLLNVDQLPEFLESSVDIILGIPFLQRFYTVFDADNRQVGFAPNMENNQAINVPPP